MIIEFLDEAEQELFEVAHWYESKEAGLGIRFRDEVFIPEPVREYPLIHFLRKDSGQMEETQPHFQQTNLRHRHHRVDCPACAALCVLLQDRQRQVFRVRRL